MFLIFAKPLKNFVQFGLFAKKYLVMENAREKSFEYANESIKLIMSLATGLLAFTITFLKEIIGERESHATALLVIGWIFLLFSILFCLWTQFSITGTLNQIATTKDENKLSINSFNIRLPAISSIVSFFIGLIFLIIFALKNI